MAGPTRFYAQAAMSYIVVVTQSPADAATTLKPAAAGSPRWVWGVLAVLLALTAGVFATALNAPMVMDDAAILTDDLLMSFTPPWYVDQSALASRPVVAVTFALQYQLHGHDPALYRAVNIGLHLLAVVLIFLLIRDAVALASAHGGVADWVANGRDGLALVTAAVWAIHPLNTETVVYVVQRTELLVILAYVMVMLAAVQGWLTTGTRRRTWQVVAVAVCCGGMACKEVMFSAPLAVLLLDYALRRSGWRAMIRESGRLYAGLFASWLLLFALMLLDGRDQSVGFHHGVSAWDYLQTQAGAIVMYLRMVFWPTGLSILHPHAMVEPWSTLPQGGLVLLLLATTLWGLVHHPRLAIPGALFFMVLAPSSSFVPIVTEPIAERRMYLPLACVVLVLVLCVGWVASRVRGASSGAWRSIAVGSGLLVVMVCAVLTAVTLDRLRDFESAERVYLSTLEQNPTHTWALNNLGRVLIDDGRPGEAIPYLVRAVRLNADDLDMRANLGYALAIEGRLEEALPHFAAAARLAPNDVVQWLNLGKALVETGQPERGLAAYRRALALDPDNPLARQKVAELSAGE